MCDHECISFNSWCDKRIPPVGQRRMNMKNLQLQKVNLLIISKRKLKGSISFDNPNDILCMIIQLMEVCFYAYNKDEKQLIVRLVYFCDVLNFEREQFQP